MAELSSHPPIEIPRGGGKDSRMRKDLEQVFPWMTFYCLRNDRGRISMDFGPHQLAVRTTPRRPVTDSTPRASSPLASSPLAIALEWLKATCCDCIPNDDSTYPTGHSAYNTDSNLSLIMGIICSKYFSLILLNY